ncbi:MAG: hypothetical protein JXQ69_09380 [Paludibacteraceae bacterium]|nr:hypothetical protein [Paludibacteraceae bacterium]MBN2788517.1 hypothetical protein [Paludibacteraceae bacterium]
MFQQLTIKVRFYIFLAGILLAILLSYQLAIKKTIVLSAENKEQTLQLDSIKQGAFQINQIKAKLNELRGQIGSQASSNMDVHQEILNTCSKFCAENNLLVREYPDKELIEVGSSKLEINKIIVEGSFHKSLQLVHLCENDKRLGRVVSVQFVKQKDVYAQKEKLLTSIYLQNMQTGSNLE